MGVGILDHRIQIAQPIADFAGHLRRGQIVQDRFVVFIHQNDHPLPGSGVSVSDQLAKASRARRSGRNGQPQRRRLISQEFADFLFQLRPGLRTTPPPKLIRITGDGLDQSQ